MGQDPPETDPFRAADVDKSFRFCRASLGWGDHPDSSVINVVLDRNPVALSLRRDTAWHTAFMFAVADLAALGRLIESLFLEVVLRRCSEDKLFAAVDTDQKPRLSSIVFQNALLPEPALAGLPENVTSHQTREGARAAHCERSRTTTGFATGNSLGCVESSFHASDPIHGSLHWPPGLPT